MLLNNGAGLLCFFLFITIRLVCAGDIGNVCRLDSKNTEGKCVLLKECPHALNGLKEGVIPQVCAFNGKEPVVCCEAMRKQVAGEISKQKCAEYGENVYTWEYPPILEKNPVLVKVDTCASAAIQLIVGGTTARPNEFPHMALIGFKEENEKKWQCSGTLISDQYVLTAAHCINTRNFGLARWVRLGDFDISTAEDNVYSKEFNISEIVVHPDFKAPSVYNDIALIKLNAPVKFNRYIRPACLHTAREINETRVLATDWTSEYFTGNRNNVLKKIVLEKVSQEKCYDAYKNNMGRKLNKGILPETQLCAGNAYEKDICQNDSGGPIQVHNREVYCMYDVVGVTSFGRPCGIRSVPGVYTRVSAYIDWIEKIVWPEKK